MMGLNNKYSKKLIECMQNMIQICILMKQQQVFFSIKGFAHVHDKRQVWSDVTLSDAILVDLSRLREMQLLFDTILLLLCQKGEDRT